jgi:hypothetical protein
MPITGFNLEYSIICSFLIAFSISIFLYGYMSYFKIINERETIYRCSCSFLTVLMLLTIINVERLRINDCHYSCIVIYDYKFDKCCNDGGWSLY